MIAFIKSLFRRKSLELEIARLERNLDTARKERDNWKAQYKTLNRQYDDLSRAQEYERSISGAISREIYQAKILKPLGNTLITAQDSPQSTGFKMGIQHALRHVEQEVVA